MYTRALDPGGSMNNVVTVPQYFLALRYFTATLRVKKNLDMITGIVWEK